MSILIMRAVNWMDVLKLD